MIHTHMPKMESIIPKKGIVESGFAAEWIERASGRNSHSYELGLADRSLYMVRLLSPMEADDGLRYVMLGRHEEVVDILQRAIKEGCSWLD